MNKRIWWKDPEMITALSAVVIGVAALLVGAYQTKIASEQQSASVWPYVSIGRFVNQDYFGFEISNKGVGPAIIKKFEVSVNDKPMQTWAAAFIVMAGEKENANMIYSSISQSVLAVQENIKMIKVTNKEYVRQLVNSESEINIKVCYCSVFNECWITKKEIRGMPVNSCEDQLSNIFLQ